MVFPGRGARRLVGFEQRQVERSDGRDGPTGEGFALLPDGEEIADELQRQAVIDTREIEAAMGRAFIVDDGAEQYVTEFCDVDAVDVSAEEDPTFLGGCDAQGL